MSRCRKRQGSSSGQAFHPGPEHEEMTLSPCTPIVSDGGPDVSVGRRNRLSTIRAYPALRHHTRTNVIHCSIWTEGRVPGDAKRIDA